MNMKRQLVEDLKTRLKFLQEMEKSYRGQLEDLEKKVMLADTALKYMTVQCLFNKMT